MSARDTALQLLCDGCQVAPFAGELGHCRALEVFRVLFACLSHIWSPLLGAALVPRGDTPCVNVILSGLFETSAPNAPQ